MIYNLQTGYGLLFLRLGNRCTSLRVHFGEGLSHTCSFEIYFKGLGPCKVLDFFHIAVLFFGAGLFDCNLERNSSFTTAN